MKIYLAHPITGLSFDEVVDYYRRMQVLLTGLGYDVLHPMTGKGELRTEREFKSGGYHLPMSTDHAIFSRDRWMVHQADVVHFNFARAEKPSIGMLMELAIAADLGRHTVVVLPEGNVHNHAFVREASHVIFPDLEASQEYLRKLAIQRP